MGPGSVLFGGGLPWIYPLALALAHHCPTVAIQLDAALSPFRNVSWPFENSEKRPACGSWTYPPGFYGTFAAFLDRPIRARLRNTVERLSGGSREPAHAIVPDPAFVSYVSHIIRQRLVYLNYDDYGPTKLSEENRLVERAETILCRSLYQPKRVRA